MPLVIRKKITLEILGEEYKDAYLTFKAIPVGELGNIQAKMPKEDDADQSQAIPVMLDLLKTYFLDGKFPNEKGELESVVKDDLNNLDAETSIHCFQVLSGVDPKAEGNLMSSSTPSTSTESQDNSPQENI